MGKEYILRLNSLKGGEGLYNVGEYYRDIRAGILGVETMVR